jgi:sRNA-binding carbon storage regulator CsrA
MLVVSRKKHETIDIDGSIHVEIVSHMKDLVWVKLLTPRSVNVTAGSKKELRGNSLGSSNATTINGHDQFNLAIGTREFVRLGDAIVLGVIDADSSRALFFVEAPTGTTIVAHSKSELEPEVRSSGQSLLQFMEPGERLKRDQEADFGGSPTEGSESKKNGSHAPGMKNSSARPLRKRDSGPNLLPFPFQPLPKKTATPLANSRPEPSLPTNSPAQPGTALEQDLQPRDVGDEPEAGGSR